jgi:hypothetical protein
MRVSSLDGDAGRGQTVKNGGHTPSTRLAARSVRVVAGSGRAGQ